MGESVRVLPGICRGIFLNFFLEYLCFLRKDFATERERTIFLTNGQLSDHIGALGAEPETRL